jgi:cell division protein FtsW
VAGLLTQFGVQAFINMGVALQMLPAKGMTLPFLSYGGSSIFAVSLAMGMVLALTRKRFRARVPHE